MARIKLLWMMLFALTLLSCRKETFDKYERPDWLTGRIYDIILEQEELSTFATAVELIGYDTIINTSGNYTVFGPSDEAFDAYFANNPNYSSIEDMPISELDQLVKYHMVQNPWSKLQLRSLDVYGWIDTLDNENNQPRGFKRETLLREDDQKYGIELKFSDYESREIIVDTLESDWHKKAASDSRKHVPFFFREYFEIYDLQSSDYEFYFDRPFEGSDEIYYAGAKIVSDENIGENGFVYVIDRVVEPLKNAYQILSESGDHDYSDFLDLVNQFPSFSYNEKKTEEQPGFSLGLKVDSLYDLFYPELPVDINTEKTKSPRGTYGLPDEVTIRYHYGVTAPVNEALAQFEQQYFQVSGGWGSLDKSPFHIKKIVVNTYLSSNPIYATDIDYGYYNGEVDVVFIDPSSIVQKEFASNSTFIGLNTAIVPRAFSSVTGPVYLRTGYKKVMYVIQQSGLLPALKRKNNDYMLFVPLDASTARDSSLFYTSRTGRLTTILRSDDGSFQEFYLTTDDLRTLILNHTGKDRYKGYARKEFIPNLAGNYIVINNASNLVSGTSPTQDGFQGPETESDVLVQISDDTDNGATYTINHWFSFSSTLMGTLLRTKYNRFFGLLQKAGLAGIYEPNANFIVEGELYTLFVPSDSALDAAQVDTLSKQDLNKLLKLHFIKGDIIFTDGNKEAGYYTTTRDNDGSSGSPYADTRIYMEPDIDVIRFYKKNREIYTEVAESGGSTNMVVARDIGENYDEDRYKQLLTYGVIHEIDKVLLFEELDTQ